MMDPALIPLVPLGIALALFISWCLLMEGPDDDGPGAA